MAITAKEVNQLRQATGAGMMDCKKALEETNGDFDQALDFLRKKGQKISQKRSDREAGEGVVVALTDDSSQYGVLIELNCETDFVAKNDDFVGFAQEIAQKALEEKPADLDALLQLRLNDSTIADRINDQVGKIGEKIKISNYRSLNGPQVAAYRHANNKIGVLVALNEQGEEVLQAGRDVAMQIAAMQPLGLDKDDVPQEVVDRELAIAKEQIAAEGKPEHMVDKIAQGKLNKFFKENTLLNQAFVKDGNKTVAQMLESVSRGLTVQDYARVAVGA
jgi:elongation factor Ts